MAHGNFGDDAVHQMRGGVPFLGSHGAQRVLVIVSVVSAAVAVIPFIPMFRWSPGAAWRAAGARFRVPGSGTLAFGALLGAAVWAASGVGPVPAGLVAWGRQLPWQGLPNALHVAEGLHSSVAVTEDFNGWRNFHVSGKVEASTEPQDMRLVTT